MPLAFKSALGSVLVAMVVLVVLAVGMSCAMLLNFLFHISVSQQGECALAGARPQTPRFQDDRGAAWRRRRTVIGRPGLAVGEALEDLRSPGVMDRPARLVARFEKYTLSLLIDYPGWAVQFAAMPTMDARALLDLDRDEEAFEAAMATLSGAAIRHLADRVDTQEQSKLGNFC